MSRHGLRLLLLWAGMLAWAAGCTGIPAPPAAANNNLPPPGSRAARQPDDENSGWLFDRMMGRTPSAAQQEPAQPQQRPGEVVPATAVVPQLSPPFGAVAGTAAGAAVPPPGTTNTTAAASSGPAPSSAAAVEPAPEDEEEGGFDLSGLAPENIWKNVKKAAGYGPNEGLARALFQEGESLFTEKKYAEAGPKFKSAAGRWPDSVLEEDAMFLLGESYFFADQYPKAQDAYENLLKKYDNSRHLDTVVKRLFAVGQYWEKLHDNNPHWPVTPNLTDNKRPLFDTLGNAIKAYDMVRLKDPTGPLADDALMATANSYFRRGRWEDAAFHYDMLYKQYPKSEHQLQAHVLGLQAKLRMYQGATYDGTPLDDAEGIAERTLTQFPTELGPERQRVMETRERIIEQKAQRDLAMAEYYDRRGYFGAARSYYQNVVKNYPLTQCAGLARQRLEQIRSEPDRPTNHFKWLSDAFDAEEKQ